MADRTRFEHRFEQVARDVGVEPRHVDKLYADLIGTYFCHEYSYIAAALMNPSIVSHPDQSMLAKGEVRFIMSKRAVGEGHISSIAFREGILEPGPHMALWPTSGPAFAVETTAYTGEVRGGVSVSRNPDATIGNTVIFPVTEAQRNGLEDLRLVQFVHGD